MTTAPVGFLKTCIVTALTFYVLSPLALAGVDNTVEAPFDIVFTEDAGTNFGTALNDLDSQFADPNAVTDFVEPDFKTEDIALTNGPSPLCRQLILDFRDNYKRSRPYRENDGLSVAVPSDMAKQVQQLIANGCSY